MGASEALPHSDAGNAGNAANSEPWYRSREALRKALVGFCGIEPRKQDTLEQRVVRSNAPEANAEMEFASNYTSTTKYTPWNFIFKNLSEQLSKAANFYFFVLALIVSVPGVSPIAAWTMYVPLCFVLAVSAIREGYEDYKRYRDDQEVNARKTWTVDEAQLRTVPWQDVRVGDIVKVFEGEFFPADMVLLSTSHENGQCAIETSNLDGETALKNRQALASTMRLATPEALCALNATVTCQKPNPYFLYFEGTYVDEKAEKRDQVQLTKDNLLLRGTMLRNTDWIFGLVIYTGVESKIYLNLNQPAHKRTNVEITTNRELYKIFFILFGVCFVFAIIFGVMRREQVTDFWYLAYSPDAADASDGWARIKDGVRDWAAFLVLYSNMVPISLYVSMELVRVGQSAFIWLDVEMYDERTRTRAVARTAALNEQLGEIEYVFCDKTGTLTENRMAFAKCSIGGLIYGDEEDELSPRQSQLGRGAGIDEGRRSLNERRGSRLLLDSGLRRANAIDFPEFKLNSQRIFRAVEKSDLNVHMFLLCLSLCHSVQIVLAEVEAAAHALQAEETKEADAVAQEHRRQQQHAERSGMAGPGEDPRGGSGSALRKHGSQQSVSLRDDLSRLREKEEQRELELIRERARDALQESIHYQASSPDEMALVVAARALGYFFCKRDQNTFTIAMPNNEMRTYELLNTVDFNSDRKRMSVIVRMPDGEIRLFTKGADMTVLPLLSQNPAVNPEALLQQTQQHLSLFSTQGLRVMVIATAVLPPAVYEEWKARYDEAALSFGNRQQRLDAVGAEVERNLQLIGVTAIEDKLQDGVPLTIKRLRQAGMKVWMLTGDKQETAINIGKSCNLIGPSYLQFPATGCDAPDAPGGRKRDSVFSLRAFEQTGMNINMVKDRGVSNDAGVVDAEGDAKSDQGTDSLAVEGKGGRRPPEQQEAQQQAPQPDGQEPRRMVRQKTQHDIFVEKIEEAKRNEPRRRAEIGRNLHALLDTMDGYERAAAEARAMDRRGADLRDVERMGMNGATVVVDGPTLEFCLHEENADAFLRVVDHRQCRSVICARMTPKQKASVVELVKHKVGAATLAIGDGANDVSMIQSAHVGVGISGQEGMQAVNASDYSIAQFRFLGRLLLVHGRWSFTRNSMMILYFFYKNFAVSYGQLWFTLFAAFSDQEIYDGILLNSFNLFWTSLPILFLGFFDRDVDASECLRFPQLYQDRDFFVSWRFWYWASMGVFHSLVVFFYSFFSLNGSHLNQSFWSYSLAAYTFLVVIVTVKLLVMHNSFTWPNVFVISLSIVGYLSFAFFYESEAMADIAPTAFGVTRAAMREPFFWFGLIFAIAVGVLPDLTIRYVQRQWSPRPRDIVQELKALGKLDSVKEEALDEAAAATAAAAASEPAKPQPKSGGTGAVSDPRWASKSPRNAPGVELHAVIPQR